jgi:hypothetical protein
MDVADCLPGTAVTVKAADDFYKFIDGWNGLVGEYHQAGCIQIRCLNPDGQPVEFLVPPDQLQRGHL